MHFLIVLVGTVVILPIALWLWMTSGGKSLKVQAFFLVVMLPFMWFQFFKSWANKRRNLPH